MLHRNRIWRSKGRCKTRISLINSPNQLCDGNHAPTAVTATVAAKSAPTWARPWRFVTFCLYSVYSCRCSRRDQLPSAEADSFPLAHLLGDCPPNDEFGDHFGEHS